MTDKEKDSNNEVANNNSPGEVKKTAKKSSTLAKFQSINNKVTAKKKVNKPPKNDDISDNEPETENVSEPEGKETLPTSKAENNQDSSVTQEEAKEPSIDTNVSVHNAEKPSISSNKDEEDHTDSDAKTSELEENDVDEKEADNEKKELDSKEDGPEDDVALNDKSTDDENEDVTKEDGGSSDVTKIDESDIDGVGSSDDKITPSEPNESNDSNTKNEAESDSKDKEENHESAIQEPVRESNSLGEHPSESSIVYSYDFDDEENDDDYDFEDDTRDLDFDKSRKIDDPSRFLIEHDSFNHNSIKIDPPLYKPEQEDVENPDFLSHKASEIKNETVRNFNPAGLKTNPSSRTKSLTIIETHAPAIIISNGIDYDTLTVLVLHEYKDGTDLYSQIRKFEDEHETSVIHSMFSLVSHEANLEVELFLEQIAQIQRWLGVDTFTTAHLYMLDSHSFSEYYKLSQDYYEAKYLSQKKDIKQKLRSIDKNSSARLLEYKSRWWVRNIEKQPVFFDNIKHVSSSNTINLNDYSSGWWLNALSFFASIQHDLCFCVKVKPSSLVENKETFEKIASTVVEISNTPVHNPAFIKSFQYIAKYLAPEAGVHQINQIANRLANQKQLAFLSLVYMISYAHALFYSCAHRFFYHNCKRDEYDEWVDQLYSNKFIDSRVALDDFRIKQAVDVDYARYLLNKPLPSFEDDYLRKSMVRYDSSTLALQSDAVLEMQAKNDLVIAINNLVTIWQAGYEDFSVSAWFEMVTEESPSNYPVDLVDMVFVSISNLLLNRDSYLFEGFSGKKLIDFLRLFKKASSFYQKKVSVYSKQGLLPEPVKDRLQSEFDLTCDLLKNILNTPDKAKVVVCDSYTEGEMSDGRSTEPNIYYILNAPKKYSPAIKSLTLKGQCLCAFNPSLNINVKEAPPTKNPDIVKQTYNHYTVVFEAMRQMGMHIYEFANQIRSKVLRDEIKACAESKAFGWWLAHQSKFLYGTPSDDLVSRRELIIESLEKSQLSLGDKYALDGIKNKKWLHLPDIKTCNTDAWIAALTNHLAASLQSPQVVTLALDLITNGRHPTLLFNDGHDDLLHHVLISKQGQSLPFSLIYETRNELYALEGALKDNPNDQKSLDRKTHLSELLIRIEEQRESEILSIFQQEKEMDRPLIVDAIKCFLSEAQEYYIQDVYGNRKEIPYKEALALLESNPNRSAFTQMLNTLMQYISEGFFPELPLSSIDTIAHHISSHGYCINNPKNRKYKLKQGAGKLGKKWSLELVSSFSPTNTDIRITTYKETKSEDNIKHPTRSSVLVLCDLPSSRQSLRDIKSSVYKDSPALAFSSEVDCWCPAPLCEADVLRFEVLRDYLSGSDSRKNRYLSDSANISATHHLNTSVAWLPMSYIHRESDAVYILSMIAQKPFDSQKNHIASFNDRIDVQTKMSKSKERFVSVKLPQAAFTRREPAHKIAKKPSLESFLTNSLLKNNIPIVANKVLLGRSDNIHDIYYRERYKPIESSHVLRSIAKHSVTLKKDLSEMIKGHPQIESLINSLSDHETNPEADYFLELNDAKKEAYIYKYLIQDMGYRGIVEKISADLYNNTLTEKFSANKAVIASKLMDTSNNYESIKNLCLFIQETTGYSMYAEQLQAQVLAKKLIEYRVDTVCEIDIKDETCMSIPVISCRPKPGLDIKELSKNLPAISTIFSRTFCDSSPDDSVYLGRNEWLVTSGIKLPHYDQIIDLNNLVCHICTSGSDIVNGSSEYLSNARHLYNTYTEKKSLRISSTHDTYQGVLSVVFRPFGDGFEVRMSGSKAGGILPYSSPLTWDKCESDLASYSKFKGISYDQLLFGKGEYYAYCLNYPNLFEFVEFNDVSGRLHKAIRMKQYAKARFSDFETLFEKVSPVNRIIASDYIEQCHKSKTPSMIIFARSNILKGEVQLKLCREKPNNELSIVLKCNHAYLLKGAYRLLKESGNYKFSLSNDNCALFVYGESYRRILNLLGLSGFYVEGELDDLLLKVLSSKSKDLTKTALTISNDINTNIMNNGK